MILTKTVEKNWTSRNMRKYINLGYRFTELGDIINVKIEHLSDYDKSNVEVMCDYCLFNGVENVVTKIYENYIKERRNVEKDACDCCKQEKYKDRILLKQQNGELKYGDKGYLNFKENRLKELKNYIEKHNTVDKIEDNLDGRRLYQSILKHKEKPFELLIELGYDLDDVMKRKPDGFYNNFSNLEYSIKKIVDKLGRFPTTTELKNELNIDHKYINFHGGIYEIKRMMKYNDKYDLIDKSGFYNSSLYELIVANFLIENKISYLREQPIVSNENYRSDFTLITTNDEIIHIEIWGYLKTNTSKIAVDYNKVRVSKERLYNLSKIKYVSIEPTIFYKMNYNNIQDSLINIFSNIIKNNTTLKKIDYQYFIPPSHLSDVELFNIAMSFSDNEDYLPETNTFRNSQAGVYTQIIKRFGNYVNFANKFNKKVKYKSNGFWTEDRVFKYFDYMISKFGKILSRRESEKEHNNDEMVDDYYKVCNQLKDGTKNLKLNYYLQKMNINEIIIPKNDFIWITQVKKNLSRRGNVPYTPQQQQQATEILEKYNDKLLNNAI